MRSVEVYRAQAVVGKLTESTRPAPAIRALAGQADEALQSPFERYAAEVLRAAGALELTEEGSAELRLLRAQGSQLVRLATPASPGKARRSVQVLEDALNRLTGIACALMQGSGGNVPAGQSYARRRRRELFERHGVEYPLWSDTERGAHVRLPPLSPGEKPAGPYFNEIDWRMLDTVADNAHAFFQAAILANLNQVIFGVKAPHCSEWDVRTRLASILGGLEPSLGFSYTFDCDTSRNMAAVQFTVPPGESFPDAPEVLRLRAPRSAQDDMVGKRSRPDQGDMVGKARVVYALRFCALLAAACFGSGRVVDHALVVGTGEDGRTLASCAFDRAQFVRETLPAIDSGTLSDCSLRFDPERVAERLSAAHIEYSRRDKTARSRKKRPQLFLPPQYSEQARHLFHDGKNSCGRFLQLRAVLSRRDPSSDDRELPADLQRLFHAKRVRDIDTSGYLGKGAAVIDEARADSSDSPASAIAQLEGIVANLESGLIPPDDQPEARPLFCEHALPRAAIALLGDELNVASEAEAFLNLEGGPDPHAMPDVCYYRAPDALFHAHVGLADLYRKLGDAQGAESQADRCIALAPTTPAGYALKADALAGRGRYKEAANVIMTGLQTAVAEHDQALLLHDLAQLFWRMGRSREASALHIHTASLSGLYAAKSLEFAKQLANGQNVHEFIRASRQEAARVIHAAGIPLVQDRTCQLLVAQAALGLANAHMPNAAAPYIAELAKRFPTNRAVTQACDSIRFGIGA